MNKKAILIIYSRMKLNFGSATTIHAIFSAKNFAGEKRKKN